MASRSVIVFGRASSSVSAWHFVRPYSEMGSSGVSSVQKASPVCAVAAIRVGVKNELPRRAELVQKLDGLEIDRPRQPGIAIARRGADHGRQRDDHVGLGEQLPHQGLVPRVARHEVQRGVLAEVEQRRLAVVQAIHNRHAVSGIQKMFAKDRSQVTGSAGDEHIR